MSWRHAFAYVAAAAFLAAVYFGTATSPPPRPSARATVATPGSAPRPAIDSLRLDARDRTVRVRRSGAGWDVVEPAGAELPSDLIDALVAAVMDTPAEPVSTDAERLHEFGLDAPFARLTFERPDAPPVALAIGGPNPAATGVYGRLDGNPQIVLLGLNVRYYIELVLKQSAP